MYVVTKTFGHELGWSCAFRQWRAEGSHCRFLHGYAFAISLEFEAVTLDARNWVIDFGSFGDLRDTLKNYFDHKTLVAQDDPFIGWFQKGHSLGMLDLVVVEGTGCEMMAKFVYNAVQTWLTFQPGKVDYVRLRRVDVSEHGANSASYIRSST